MTNSPPTAIVCIIAEGSRALSQEKNKHYRDDNDSLGRHARLTCPTQTPKITAKAIRICFIVQYV